MFDIWGFIILIWLWINVILLICFIGIKSLHSIEFAHTILIFIASLSNQNIGLMKLIVWMQLFKFDFGFVDYLNIRNILYCKLRTERMIELHFYCQSTILNYLVLIIIILISILIVFVLKYTSKYLNFTLMMYQFIIIIKVTLENWVWIFIHIFWLIC